MFNVRTLSFALIGAVIVATTSACSQGNMTPVTPLTNVAKSSCGSAVSQGSISRMSCVDPGSGATPAPSSPPISNAPGQTGGCPSGSDANSCTGDGSTGSYPPGGGSGTGTPCGPATMGAVATTNLATGTCPGTIATHPGPPTDNVGCNGSMNVGDNLGQINGQTMSVTDVNTIANAQGFPQSTPSGGLEQNVLVAGWIYRDQNGNLWVQSNPAANWTISASVTAFFASVGIGAPTVTGAHYAGTQKLTMPSGTVAQKCFGAGGSFG